MNRITVKDLRPMLDRLNSITQNPQEPVADGRFQPGCYTLSEAYGGVALTQIKSTSGAEDDVFRTGHIKKRELYDKLTAFLDGLDLGLSMGEDDGAGKTFRITVESGASVEEYLCNRQTLDNAKAQAFAKFCEEHPHLGQAEITGIRLIGCRA
jgi:hypothetical protein